MSTDGSNTDVLDVAAGLFICGECPEYRHTNMAMNTDSTYM